MRQAANEKKKNITTTRNWIKTRRISNIETILLKWINVINADRELIISTRGN